VYKIFYNEKKIIFLINVMFKIPENLHGNLDFQYTYKEQLDLKNQ
jgi:hypothetical protein